MPHRKRRRPAAPVRGRVGRISYYEHHGAWWVYYREHDKPVRRRVADNRDDAERIAAQLNAQVTSGSPTFLAFSPIGLEDLRARFLGHHEHVLRSSVATIRRYRAATQHLLDFALQSGRDLAAHELPVELFVQFLRTRKVSPNGHPHTAQRQLRDKGVRFILEVCRSLFTFAQRKRHLPPYAENAFGQLQLDRLRNETAKPIFIFDAKSEHAFLNNADDWAFPLHFLLAKSGMRPGELTHLLIEDVDLLCGWLHIRNKIDLGWRIKTGAERSIPLIPELQSVLRRVIGERCTGPVFLRQRFHAGEVPSLTADRNGLQHHLKKRLESAAGEQKDQISRAEHLRISRTVWRDAGAVKVDAIRNSFVSITKKIGVPEATCPKSWRHTFATLLQDANVDPLIRQITLGHQPSDSSKGGLGMTGVYTHTRPETQKSQVESALRLWSESLDLAAQWADARS